MAMNRCDGGQIPGGQLHVVQGSKGASVVERDIGARKNRRHPDRQRARNSSDSQTHCKTRYDSVLLVWIQRSYLARFVSSPAQAKATGNVPSVATTHLHLKLSRFTVDFTLTRSSAVSPGKRIARVRAHTRTWLYVRTHAPDNAIRRRRPLADFCSRTLYRRTRPHARRPFESARLVRTSVLVAPVVTCLVSSVSLAVSDERLQRGRSTARTTWSRTSSFDGDYFFCHVEPELLFAKQLRLRRSLPRRCEQRLPLQLVRGQRHGAARTTIGDRLRWRRSPGRYASMLGSGGAAQTKLPGRGVARDEHEIS